MIRDDIAAALRVAMKAQDKARLSALRMVSAALTNLDIEARTGGKDAPGDDAVLTLLQKLVKQRQEAAILYDKGGRPELAANERAEIDVIGSFLPQQLSDEETRAAVLAAIAETGAAGVRDMGKVMAALKTHHAGRMDFGKASGLVKGMLG